jgi:hypothetical protein
MFQRAGLPAAPSTIGCSGNPALPLLALSSNLCEAKHLLQELHPHTQKWED